MNREFFRRIGPLLVLSIAGVIAFFALLDHVSPKASVDFRLDRGQIMELASSLLKERGFDIDGLQQDAWFVFNGTNQLYWQLERGMADANEIMKSDTLAGHHWNVTWYDRSLTVNQNPEFYRAWVSPSGRLLGFSRTLFDTTSIPSVNRDEALRLAEEFLLKSDLDFSRYHLRNSQDTKHPKRVDYHFVFARESDETNDNVWVDVQGNIIGGYRINFEPVGDFERAMADIATDLAFVGTASFAVTFFLFFFMVILFLRKYHEGEVGIRTALIVFSAIFLLTLVDVINVFPTVGTTLQIGDMNQFNVRIIAFVFSVFIVHLFLAVMAFTGWSVGESSSRSLWPKKVMPADSILFGKPFSLDTSRSILHGYAWGLIILGAYSAAVYFVRDELNIGLFVPSVSGLGDSLLPFLHPILFALSIAALTEVTFRLFFLSYLRERTKRLWPGVILSSLVWSIAGFFLWVPIFGYFTPVLSFIALFVFGLIFCALFLKYDFVTTLTANFVLVALDSSIPLFSSTGSYFEIMKWLFIILLAVPVAASIVGLVLKKQFSFTPQTTPEHIRKISQRERMAKELEIARTVQLGLLPRANPETRGYDIAGICLPAHEVGGDYYDFVNLAGHKIGIAIGDVSGKGVPAAIYMTLTKGILQSHAEGNISPKKVLGKVNNLMYRTLERNSFVSMFYAILDLKARTIRFARAGQCPMILTQREGNRNSFLTPKGMALGLEKGKLFESVLEEKQIKLRRGDVLVFYTDGFTEAVNPAGEEYGEERLALAVSRFRHDSAATMLESLAEDVRTFSGNGSQRDDMTMVIVKVA